MEKTMMLNVRVSPSVKQQAEDVLKQLGIPMATAIDMYPVSYTHLRAHETDSYLVCRLLLEKKKRTPPSE